MPRPNQTRVVRDKERSAVHFQKTKMCKFHLLGVCTRGSQCSWAHSQDEMRALPDFYRTKLCHTYLSKGVCRNSECRYAHGYSELRTPDGELMDRSASQLAVEQAMQDFSGMQWTPSDVQFTFMQVIPFAPAMAVLDAPASVPQAINLEDILDISASGTSSSEDEGFQEKKRQSRLSRQTTADVECGMAGSDQSCDGRSPSRTSCAPTDEASLRIGQDTASETAEEDSFVFRVRNTFIEFASTSDDNSSDFDDNVVAARRRARSVDARSPH